jgi:hypothetical protein
VTSTVCHSLRNALGTKYCHLRWIPHRLTVAQNIEREDIAKTMLEIRGKHAVSNFLIGFWHGSAPDIAVNGRSDNVNGRFWEY